MLNFFHAIVSQIDNMTTQNTIALVGSGAATLVAISTLLLNVKRIGRARTNLMKEIVDQRMGEKCPIAHEVILKKMDSEFKEARESRKEISQGLKGVHERIDDLMRDFAKFGRNN